MKLMRLALCVAVFALVGGIAFSEDMDIRALQAKLAAQEARLNDLQAKMGAKSGGGTADNVVSLRKNAKVTIGGDMNFRMYNYNGKIEQAYSRTNAVAPKVNNDGTTTGKVAEGYTAGWHKAYRLKATDHTLNDAKLRLKIDVNDYFEAYFRFDLQQDTGWKQTQEAYVRWKNLCNSGFSVLVGRTGLVYGGGAQHGATWSGFYGGYGEASINKISGNIVSGHIGFDHSRTNQITASWQNPEGNFKAELSYFQAIEEKDAGRYGHDGSEYVKSINHGFGSGSARLTWKPIEGLNIVASALNMHNNQDYGLTYSDTTGATSGYSAANQTAVDLMVAYEPCFLPGFKIWGMFAYDWNAGWIDDVNVDKYQLGMSYRVNKFNFYGFGEYMRSDNFGFEVTGRGSKASVARVYGEGLKTKAWAGQVGFKYFVGYGVDFDFGYRYEKHESKFAGQKYAKADLHALHARLNFSF